MGNQIEQQFSFTHYILHMKIHKFTELQEKMRGKNIYQIF